MPFQPTTLFYVAHNDGGTRRVLFHQNNLATVTFTPTGTTTPPWSVVAGGVLYDGAGAVQTVGTLLASVFQVAFTTSNASGDHGTLQFNRAAFDAFVGPTFKQRFIDAIVSGGRAELQVNAGTGVNVVLVVQLRALKTADFLFNSNVAEPAHHGAVGGNNITFPAGEDEGDFTVLVADELDATLNPVAGTYQATPTLLATGNLDFPAAGSPPPDAASRNLFLKITHTTTNAVSVLPVDLHVPTDVILLLDRSGSMNRIHADSGSSKWELAKGVASLFSQLYGEMVPNLSAPNGTIVSQNRIGFGYFHWSGGTQTPFDGFVAASTTPSADPGQSPGGGTPIGEALKNMGAQFTADRWRRRQIVLLTDGMDNAGMPRLDDLTLADLPDEATSATLGVTLHNISYAVPGEMPALDLAALASSYGGQFHHSAADADPLDSQGLRDMFLTVLSGILPVERASVSNPTTVPVENGVERVIFVANRPGGGMTATLGAQNSTSSGQGNGYSWAIVDQPAPGNWTINTPPAGSQVFALYDLSLRMRCGVEPAGLGQPMKVWAEIKHKGEPVAGADVRAGVRRPGESIGEVLTTFARKGGIPKAYKRGLIDRSLFSPDKNPALAGIAPSSTKDPARAGVDTPSAQRLLLDAAEHDRNLEFQNVGSSLSLKEVSPGRYEAELSAALTQNEGVYTFSFRADGVTPEGFAFARDQRHSTVLAPVLSGQGSKISVQKVTGTQFFVTVLPVSITERPVGPGLGGTALTFQYADPKLRERLGTLATIDNLDGTYSVRVDAPDGKLPQLGLYYGKPTLGAQAGKGQSNVIVIDAPKAVRTVKVTLDRIQVLDDKDVCFTGPGELEFDAIVAPNSNPHRAVRTRIPEKGVLELSSGEASDVNVVLFEGLVEEDATLSVTVGGKELDWLLFFERREKLARYHRSVKLTPGTHRLTPHDERHDPESLGDWKLWYTVDVQ